MAVVESVIMMVVVMLVIVVVKVMVMRMVVMIGNFLGLQLLAFLLRKPP